tara:strand:- start:1042 stop:1392 length:351 start_codon:yes stop_codon:yes gene_type:complete
MALLTKEQILDADDRKTDIVEVPEWGGEVCIATMSGFARDRFEASIVGKSGGMNMQNIRAKLVAATVVDEEGALLFSEAEVNKLGQKSCAALDRVFSASQKLNAIADNDIEELAKN